jgi:hypothetical protein
MLLYVNFAEPIPLPSPCWAPERAKGDEAMPSLWLPKARRKFHEEVDKLWAHRENFDVIPEQYFRHSATRQDRSNGYTLRLRDELLLADHIAFLAQSEEGVRHISAACIHENEDSLEIRLTSNETPSAETMSDLREVLDVIQDYAETGIVISAEHIY